MQIDNLHITLRSSCVDRLLILKYSRLTILGLAPSSIILALIQN